jgi:hypothetical protein
VPPTWQDMTWSQFGAAIDMLGNAIGACSDELWTEGGRGVAGFWYLAHHTLFWLDFYASVAGAEAFGPPSPFTRSEFDDSGALPDRVYSQTELLDYLAYCRRKCRATVLGMTDARAAAPCPADRAAFGEDLQTELEYVARRGLSHGELVLYNMRHVQHHAAQLNLLIRQATDAAAPRWLSRAAE